MQEQWTRQQQNFNGQNNYGFNGNQQGPFSNQNTSGSNPMNMMGQGNNSNSTGNNNANPGFFYPQGGNNQHMMGGYPGSFNGAPGMNYPGADAENNNTTTGNTAAAANATGNERQTSNNNSSANTPGVQQPAVVEGAPDWLEYRAPNGAPYYFNLRTQQTTWVHPLGNRQGNNNQMMMNGGMQNGHQQHNGNRNNRNRNNGGNNQNNQNNQNGGNRNRLVVDGSDMGSHFIENKEGCNLFVFHLPSEWEDADLVSHFSPFGQIASAMIVREKDTGRNKGFGFVCYCSPHSAIQAIVGMNGFAIAGKRLTVQLKQHSVRRNNGTGNEEGPRRPRKQHNNQHNQLMSSEVPAPVTAQPQIEATEEVVEATQ